MIRNQSQKIAALLCFFISLYEARSQQKYQPTPENMKAREWFQDARFGLFIHWGVYSELGDGEWVMNQQQIPVATYEKLPASLTPPSLIPKSGCKW